MRTIFALFTEVYSAENAVQQLLEADYSEEQMNAITQELTAKQYLDISDHKMTIFKTDRPGHKEIVGLKALFIGHRGVNISDVGRVLACGPIAGEMAGTAVDKPHGGLRLAFKMFDIQDQFADNYTSGIIAGGVLLFVKTDPDASGEVIKIYNENKGEWILGVP